MAITKDEFFDDEYMQQFPELAATLQEGVRGAFPADQFSEQDSAQLQGLKDRIERLSAIEQPQQIGSTGMAGNPFAWDVSPAVNAAQNAIIKGVNALREKRLLDDDVRGEAEQLQSEKEADQQAKQTQQDVFKELYPNLAGKLVDLESDMKKKAKDHEYTKKEIRERTDEAIREFNQTDGGSGGGKSPKDSVRLVGDFINKAEPYKKSLTTQIEQLEKQKVAFPEKKGELNRRIKNLKDERAELEQWETDAYRALNNGNVYDEKLIDRWEGIMGVGKKAEENPQEYNFVEEMMNYYQQRNIPSAPSGAAGAGLQGSSDKIQSRVKFE